MGRDLSGATIMVPPPDGVAQDQALAGNMGLFSATVGAPWPLISRARMRLAGRRSGAQDNDRGHRRARFRVQ